MNRHAAFSERVRAGTRPTITCSGQG